LLRAQLEAQDDATDISASEGQFEISQRTWKLMADVGDYHPAYAKLLEGLFEGPAAGCGRRIPARMKSAVSGKTPFVWSIG
jgi:hypothetical protein